MANPYKALFGLKRHEHLLKVPRQYANPLDPRHDDPDAALIMGRSSARSPDNIRALLDYHAVEKVEHLLPLLPDQRHHPHPLRRIQAFLRRMAGASPYNPDLRRERRLREHGYFSRPDIHDRLTLVLNYQRDSRGGEANGQAEDTQEEDDPDDAQEAPLGLRSTKEPEIIRLFKECL